MKYGIKSKILALFMVLTTMFCATVVPFVEQEAALAGPVALVIGGIIVVLITVALMNTIINNTKTVTANTNIDASTSSMVKLLPFGVALIAFISLFSFLM
jgi:hypothetical protein